MIGRIGRGMMRAINGMGGVSDYRPANTSKRGRAVVAFEALRKAHVPNIIRFRRIQGWSFDWRGDVRSPIKPIPLRWDLRRGMDW